MKRGKKGFRLIKYISVFILIFSFSKDKNIYSQFFEWGQDPASIKWNRLDTENFQIIFPREISENAVKISSLLEESYKKNALQLNHKPFRVPVVIHNQSVISNGFVGIAPRRMEIFMHPDPKGYPDEWLKQLAIHEQRHVTQISKVNQGFTRFLSNFIGEQANGYGAALLPFWLIEGDAVWAETSLSNTGRGRLPAFEKELKVILAYKPEGYSHEKSFLGSYKDFIPDYYRYGFQMVRYGREKYGDNFWPDAISFTGKNSWMISPLSYYIKTKTGLNRTQFHNESIKFMRSHWEKTSQERTVKEYVILNNSNKTYTNYQYPYLPGDSSIVTLKTGLDIIPAIIKINPNGSETHIFTPGTLNSGRISVYNNKILWDEYRSDLRWSNRSFSILREYDMETGSVRSLSRKSRYSSPSYSPGGDTIIAVEINPLQETFLVIISATDGKVIEKIPGYENAFLQSPEWIKGTETIAAIAVNEKGKAIVLYDRNKRSWSQFFNAGFFDIQDLRSTGSYLLFQGSYNGIDDIYAINFKNKNVYRISNSQFGAYQPAISSDESLIIFSMYTKDGFQLSKTNFKPSQLNIVNIDSLITETQPFFNTRIKDSIFIQPVEPYEPDIKKYPKLTSLFRFHSWLPFYLDYNHLTLDNRALNPGVSLVSQNILSTALSSLGYEYNNKEHIFHAAFTYKGILPVFNISADYGGVPISIPKDTAELITKNNKYLFYNFQTFIPLNLSSGKVISGVRPILKLSYSGNYYYYESEKAYNKGIYFLEPRIYLYSYLQMAYRDLQPKWGFIADGKRLSTPFEKEIFGSLSSLKSVIYLPGLISNHGIKFQYQMQVQKPEKYLPGNEILFPRGYKNLTAIKLSKFSADYILPLIYPDIKLGSVFYLKRIYASAFGDYMKGSQVYERNNNHTTVSNKNIYSIGTEINFEYHFFRFLFPFIQGIRASYISEKGKFVYESLFNININRF